MQKPLGTKYLILVPAVLNIGIFYMLAAPLGWVKELLDPMWEAVLMCCGVAMTAMMALAYVRVHQASDTPATKNKKQRQAERAAAPAAPMGANVIPTSAEAIGSQKTGTMIGGDYSPETSQAEQKA